MLSGTSPVNKRHGSRKFQKGHIILSLYNEKEEEGFIIRELRPVKVMLNQLDSEQVREIKRKISSSNTSSISKSPSKTPIGNLGFAVQASLI